MIYFWKINGLKSDLMNKGLSGRQALIYLLCILIIQIISWAFTYVTAETHNLWDHIDAAAFIIFLAVGTVYCCYANGGRKGKDFVFRYLSLAWVFGVRYSIMVLLPLGLALYMTLQMVTELPDKTQWYDVLFISVIRIPFYFFLAGHIRDVALNRVPSDKGISGYRDRYAEDFDQSKYPTTLRRYMATFIDVVIVLSAFIALAYILPGDNAIGSMIRIGIGVAILFIYEPVLTSRLCTIGQKIMGIRVRNADSGERISIPAAYLRTIVKLLLGLVSFFSIPLTRKRRGLHDFIAGSVVIYAD